MDAESLRQQHIKQIFDIMPEAVLLLDKSQKVTACNRTALSMFGCMEQEIIGNDIGLLWAPHTINSRLNGLWATRGWMRKGIAMRKDGTTFPAALTMVMTDETTTGALPTAIIQDLREGEGAERQVQQLQSELARLARLNELGEMASTLAHELTQPLAAIANYSQGCARLLASKRPQTSEQVQDVLSEITHHALRAGDIIRHLREFITRGGGEKRTEHVQELTEEAMKLALMGSRLAGITTEFCFQARRDVVLVDRIQIEQVLTNLIRNAIEAMDSIDNPRLTVTTRNETDDSVIVEVSDTGSGIAAEVEATLFRPFVSSKPRGLGIGLAMSKRIIEAHGGRITARRRASGGSTFAFSLPLIEGAPDAK
ncbi:PAS domain-containing sensor histidine kinase [Rhizobium mayense]|uniref:histidine kinase n=1 Tax=Rhizobium mayense TaxID=1312184 RepID=A0ABT7JSG6_9HYPH|nr:ATP-binding protein [Rhizobium mayense]MDL2398852.1 ATP-binding protein [Rhizobium mayense]